MLEALVETGGPSQDPVADHGPCVPAGSLEGFGQSRHGFGDDRPVAPDTDFLGVATGENRGHGGEGVGARCIGGREDLAVPGQRIDSGRQAPVAAVGTESIGPQGVYAQQQHQPVC